MEGGLNQERILNREEINLMCKPYVALCFCEYQNSCQFVETRFEKWVLKTFYPSRIRKHIKWLLESICEVKPC